MIGERPHLYPATYATAAKNEQDNAVFHPERAAVCFCGLTVRSAPPTLLNEGGITLCCPRSCYAISPLKTNVALEYSPRYLSLSSAKRYTTAVAVTPVM